MTLGTQFLPEVPQPPPSASDPACSPDAGPRHYGLHEPPLGQLILGTDKRNPVFALYEDDSREHLIVFYGFAILGRSRAPRGKF